MITILIIVGLLAGIGVFLWLGLQVKPKSFAPYTQSSQPREMVPLPTGLPALVEWFSRTVYGDAVPVIKTVMIKGRAVLRPFGPRMPARFIFIHNTRQDYRHYIMASWLDQGKPWAVFNLEEVEYNVEVSEYIRQKGP